MLWPKTMSNLQVVFFGMKSTTPDAFFFKRRLLLSGQKVSNPGPLSPLRQGFGESDDEAKPQEAVAQPVQVVEDGGGFWRWRIWGRSFSLGLRIFFFWGGLDPY